MEQKISNYGHTFQTKLIACLLSDKNFLGSIYDLIKPEYFDSKAIQFLLEKTLEYFHEYNLIPTLDVFKVQIDKISDDVFKKEIVLILKESIRYLESTDLDFIKQTTIEFCKNQEIKSAILESVPLVKSGNYDKIKVLVDNALKIGLNNDIGLDYFSNIEDRYEEKTRNVVATPWPVLNNIMKGGLAGGELGVFIAGSGGGKSFILCALGAEALRQGKTVVYYTLELNESYVGLRYDAMLSGISLDKLPTYKEEVKKKLKDISGKLIIKLFPSKSISLIGLKAHFNKLKALNINPDLILLDYGDLLKYEIKGYEKHDALEVLYEELRGWAIEEDVPLYTVSQANKASTQGQQIEGDGMAGAFAKLFPVDFAASINRKAQDKISNTARLHIIKNRIGVDGVTFPMHMDTSKALINIYEPNTEQGMETTRNMKSDSDYDKQLLKKRLSELRSNDENNSIF